MIDPADTDIFVYPKTNEHIEKIKGQGIYWYGSIPLLIQLLQE